MLRAKCFMAELLEHVRRWGANHLSSIFWDSRKRLTKNFADMYARKNSFVRASCPS